MKISDEQLSAFLDAELPDDEMEIIRQCISDDETLANRLAELAMVDDQVARHYAGIDEQPMPAAINQLLEEKVIPAANVIESPARQKKPSFFQGYAAVAACAAVFIGIGVVQWTPGGAGQATRDWSKIAQVLETQVSGTEQQMADGIRVKPRLTFVNKNGNYCRQFQIIATENATKNTTENIACRTENEWELTASIEQQPQVTGDYQPASGDSQLDERLNEMIDGDLFDAAAEQRAIEKRWQD